MATVVDVLEVQVTANTKNYTSGMKSITASAKQVGSNLNKFVTLPLGIAAAAAIKFAIAAEETNAKFNTAFKGIEDQAAETAKALADGFGLAQSESERLLSGTGDLLKGFGFTADEALNLSNSVQELAVDLASYNNLEGGATRASEILTKALLGERDALVSLGTKVSDADVQQRLLEKGQKSLTGQALLAAKAQATYELILTQTLDAQGDFARTSDSTANQLRVLRANAIDMAVTFGKELLPTVNKLVTELNDLVKGFSELAPETKRNIVIIAGVAAAAGPAITAVTGLATAMGALQIVLAGPGGVIALVGLLVAGFVALNKHADAKRIENVADRFSQLGKELMETGRSAQEVADTIDLIEGAVSSAGAMGFGPVVEQIQIAAEELGLTEQQVARIAVQSKGLSDEYKSQLDTMYGISDLENQIAAASRYRAQTAQGLVILAHEENEALKALKETTVETTGAERERLEALVEEMKAAYQEKLYITQWTNEQRIDSYTEMYKELDKKAVEHTKKSTKEIQALARNIRSAFSSILSMGATTYQGLVDLNKDGTDKQKAEARKQFEVVKDINIAQTIMSTAAAAMEAYKALAGIPFVGPGLGAAAALAVGYFGARQVDTISRQKPGFETGTPAEGFVVPPGHPDDSFNVGVSSDEVVNVTPADNANQQTGGQTMIANLVIDGRILGRVIFDGTQNGDIMISDRAVVTV